MQKQYAEIIVELTNPETDQIYHYGIKEAHREIIAVGMRVLVPFGFGNRKIEGYVIGFSDDTPVAPERIKLIADIPDTYPVISEEMVNLAWWMKEKYYCSLSSCLQCIIPVGVGMDVMRVRKASLIHGAETDEYVKKCMGSKSLAAQAAVLEYLFAHGETELGTLRRRLKVSDSPIKTLAKKGFVQIKEYLPSIGYDDPVEVLRDTPRILTAEQQSAVDVIAPMVAEKRHHTVLIHGVTGSGKTEVYLRLIQEAMDTGREAIVLVPEISLTPQTVRRILERFGRLVSLTHSKMTQAERFCQWQKARCGDVKVMIGPRSAVFAPFSKLGLIIIDEEHETSYRSDTMPKYDAREVGKKRMEIGGGVLVLGSATPSLETYYQAKSGEIGLVTIYERVGISVLPEITVIDMRDELEEGNRSIFSTALREAMEMNIANGEQVILFLNRRGHSSFVSCRKCGYVMKCDSCSISYTYHQFTDKLMCHYCGKTADNPEVCPQCGSKHIKYFGVGTQKIEDGVKKLFPDIEVLRMDMDTTQQKHSHGQILKRFGDGQAQILIGTQMIAKGHDFPGVTLVGIVSADMSLNVGDFSSAETTFQLITQVAGRAGRGDLPGRVFVQTYSPDHYSIVHALHQSYESFYEEEIKLRSMMKYPPFSSFFIVQMTGEDERKLIIEMYHLAETLKYYNSKRGDFTVIAGPMPCYISKIKNRYRWKLLIKCDDEERLKRFVVYCVQKVKKSRDLDGINVSMTLNPKTMV